MLRPGSWRAFGFPIAVFAVGLASTALVALLIKDAATEQDRERFENAVDRLQDSIRDRIEMYVTMLRAGAGMMTAADIGSPEQFRAFVERLELRTKYPGVQGIGFAARVPAERLQESLAQQRRQGRPGFTVAPSDPPRPEYYPILYLEPLDERNRAAIGYDMFEDATRRVAMERARDSGEPATSGLVTLVQEIDEDVQPGFLIYVPVYEQGAAPSTAVERQRTIRGFVYSPFRAHDLFRGILGTNPHSRAGFELYDGSVTREALLYRTTEDPDTGRFSLERSIDVAGRAWTAEFFSTPSLDESSSGEFLPMIAGGGSAVTILLTVLAVLQTRARQRAEASERRADDASRSLQEQADTLEIVNRTGAQLAGELDLDRLVQAITDAGTRLTRAQFGAFFYNETNERGESYTLYSLSGVPREAFAAFPMPRNTPVFGPTFRGDGIIRSGDITADPRYGHNAPHKGMPEGHLPVRSYLAVPVRSRSGDVLGGLFFGHSERDVFTEQSANIVTGIAAQAAVAIDNARLYGQVQQLLASERAARAEAERVSRLKDEFLATLSHELRTPLNAVVGWGHMLHSGALGPEKQRVAIDTILRNARIQSQLIEELLDMSRIISGRVGLDMTAVDLREIVEAAVNVVRPTAGAKRIDIEIAGEPGLHAVRGDGNRLQQIVWNLLSNAVKFTPPGGRVTVSFARVDEQIELAVTDTGIGIDPEFLPYVFERFRQADGSYTRRHGGLGLGLSIVRSLVEMHAGTVRAWSAGPQQGATFTVCLPAATAAELAGAWADRREPADVLDTSALSGLSVLVVDDEADAGDLAAEILTQCGARVVVARTGTEALRRLHGSEAAVGLIVSDLGMPQMDGYELIRRIRALPPSLGGTAPAIALTAYAGPNDQSRALAAGYDLHLSKPFTPADLIAVCTRLVKTGADLAGC